MDSLRSLDLDNVEREGSEAQAASTRLEPAAAGARQREDGGALPAPAEAREAAPAPAQDPLDAYLRQIGHNELLTREANQRWNNLIADEPTIKGATSDPKLKDYIGFTNQWHPDQNVVVKNWPTWSERHKKEIEPLFGK